MMNQVYKTLPDDRPVMSIYVIEDPEKCPAGCFVVSTLSNIRPAKHIILNDIKLSKIIAVQYPRYRKLI
jgi:hypothetical protein